MSAKLPNPFRGYCWCATCEHFAPLVHECAPTRRAELVARGRKALVVARPFIGRALTDALGELLSAWERVPIRAQGVWNDANGRYFTVDGSGKTVGPFETAGKALEAYVLELNPKTKRTTAIYSGKTPSADHAVSSNGRRTSSANAEGAQAPYRLDPEYPPTHQEPVPGDENIGLLIAEVPGNIQIYRREERFLFVQDGDVITLEFAGMLMFARAIEKAVDRGDPFDFARDADTDVHVRAPASEPPSHGRVPCEDENG